MNTGLVLASPHDMGGLWSILRALAILRGLFKDEAYGFEGISHSAGMQALGLRSFQCRMAHAPITVF